VVDVGQGLLIFAGDDLRFGQEGFIKVEEVIGIDQGIMGFAFKRHIEHFQIVGERKGFEFGSWMYC
jgi:hypothetical protein